MPKNYQIQTVLMNEQEKLLFRNKVKNDVIGYVFIVAVFIGIATLIAWNVFPIRNIDKIALVFSLFGGLIFLSIFGAFIYLFSMIFLDIKHSKKQVIEGVIVAKREHFFHNRKAGQQQKNYYISIGEKEISVDFDLFRAAQVGQYIQLHKTLYSKTTLKYELTDIAKEEKQDSTVEPIFSDFHSQEKLLSPTEQQYFNRVLRKERNRLFFSNSLIVGVIAYIGWSILYFLLLVLINWLEIKEKETAFLVFLLIYVAFLIAYVFKRVEKKIKDLQQDKNASKKRVEQAVIQENIISNAKIKTDNLRYLSAGSRGNNTYIKANGVYYAVESRNPIPIAVGQTAIIEYLPNSRLLLSIYTPDGSFTWKAYT